jgi:hypothetical protein
MKNRNSIKLTVLFEDPFWIGVFERHAKNGCAIAKYIFGAEPSEPKLYDFLLKNFNSLKFTTPTTTLKYISKKKNPKRIKREVSQELNKKSTITKAQEAIKQEQGKYKQLKKHKSTIKKHNEAAQKFTLKQLKKKEKIRGH